MLKTIIVAGLASLITVAVVKGDLTCKVAPDTFDHVRESVSRMYQQSEAATPSNGPQDFGPAPVYRKADGDPTPLHSR